MAYRWREEAAGRDGMSAVYKHPDGHKINLTRGCLTVTNGDTDESVSVPVGEIGLRELGERLIALSKREAGLKALPKREAL